ncbi:MAG: SCP2 sterol-binding domain-containing protein [Anaerolineae bacterium]|nr:SCP2 sterol-binding domain-containing protein [Anaerolineae bacterium]
MPEKATTVDEVFARMGEVFKADKAAGMDAVFQFDLSGDNGGQYWIKVMDGAFESGQGQHENPSVTLLASADDYIKIANGDMAAMSAFMSGKLKVKGEMGLALKLQQVFPTT